jgi:raffinose/stachyose/melibiose transport system substrate-binding protein
MKWLGLCLVLILGVVGLVGCGAAEETNSSDASEESSSDTDDQQTEQTSPETVTLKFFTALADRSNGTGKIEQQLIDNYMAEHPNVIIEVEALQDEPYKAKTKIYASTNKMPDIIQAWGQPSFIDPLINNDLLLELNEEEFKTSQFIPGSLDGFSKEGKLYGLSRGVDYFVLYYNKKIFADNGLQPPTTTSELLDVVHKLRQKNINPIAINGMDGWSLPIWFEYVVQRETGEFHTMDKALNRQASFTDPAFVAAAQNMQKLALEKGFADGYLTADYGAARNLFGQQQAAMYLMGNWEAGLATDENFSEEFRENVGALPYPASDKGKTTDVAAWFGGGYAISKNTEHKEEAVAFLKYFFKPENWPKSLWQSGAGTPAQIFDKYLTGNETVLQQELINIFNGITSTSGTPVLDSSTPEFKQAIMDLHQKLLVEELSPQEFAKQLDDAAEAAQK